MLLPGGGGDLLPTVVGICRCGTCWWRSGTARQPVRSLQLEQRLGHEPVETREIEQR